MIAFHKRQELKTALVAQLEAHYAADEIIKGQYWENGKGCAIGCSVHNSSHELMAATYGIPTKLCHLLDSIFEGLSNSEAKEFPLKFIESIPVGSDLSKIWNRFAAWLLIDPIHGVSKFNKDPSIDAVAKLHQTIVDGLIVQPQSLAAAASAARAAAQAAASAARAAGWAAAWAADAAWAAGDARADAWAAQAARLCDLLAAA